MEDILLVRGGLAKIRMMGKKRSLAEAKSPSTDDIEEREQLNPWTGRPLSATYHELQRQRERLPIMQARQRLLELLDAQQQFVVLVGETGSGKTTQVPRFLAEHLFLPSAKDDAGDNNHDEDDNSNHNEDDDEGADIKGGKRKDQTHRMDTKLTEKDRHETKQDLKSEDDKKMNGMMVGCTQPRRVAAMSVARRVAAEMDAPVGNVVGYTIRFEDCTTEATRVKYLTDGMLLREALADKLLSRYAALVLDEAHERTASTDLLLGLLKQHICPRRPDLRVIVMSATLEAEKFQRYLHGCPLVQVPGRCHPVDAFYSRQPESDYFEAALRTVVQIHATEPLPGDILVFLTGEEEIEDACRRCRFLPNAKSILPLPLYGSLSPKAQERIFEPTPPGKRKIVFATNIAETSVTIDGVVYVVDCGFHKQRIYHPQQRLDSLLVAPISQASARQRAGRAGRTRPGKCYRLYTEQSYEKELRAESYPEILRCNLGAVILQLKAVGVEDLVHFDFLDAPAPETLMRALETLLYLGALDEATGDVTRIGWQLSELPLEPCLGKMLLTGCSLGVGHSTLAIVSCLSVPPVHIRPSGNEEKLAADSAKAALSHPDGDHLTFLGVFDAFLSKLRADGEDAVQDWCWEQYLSYRSLTQAISIYEQLRAMLKQRSLKTIDDPKLAKADRDALVKEAVCAGFFLQSACRLPGKTSALVCVGPAASVARVHPGTCLLPGNGDWLIYHELVMTSQQYVRTVCAVKPALLVRHGRRFLDELSQWPRNEAHRQLQEIVSKEREGSKK